MPRAVQTRCASSSRTASACTYGRPGALGAEGRSRLRALDRALWARRASRRARAAEGSARGVRGCSPRAASAPLPRLPRRIGLVTGSDAAAKRDVLTTIQARFPCPRAFSSPRRSSRARARPRRWWRRCARSARRPRSTSSSSARGGGSFQDLLPFSGTSGSSEQSRPARCRSSPPSGTSRTPPLCDFAADRRASTPTAAGRLVVPDFDELLAGLARSRDALGRGARRTLERHSQRLAHSRERLRRAPALLVERRRAALAQAVGRLRALSPRSTLERGYAIVRREGELVRSADAVSPGDRDRGRGRRRLIPERWSNDVRGRSGEGPRSLQIVERLERGDAGLDEALALWQRGEELYRFCAEQLDAAEGKIEELAKRVDATRPDG